MVRQKREGLQLSRIPHPLSELARYFNLAPAIPNWAPPALHCKPATHPTDVHLHAFKCSLSGSFDLVLYASSRRLGALLRVHISACMSCRQPKLDSAYIFKQHVAFDVYTILPALPNWSLEFQYMLGTL